MDIHRFENCEILHEEFANRLIEILNEAIAVRGEAYLAVSGGKTPAALFEVMAAKDLNWNAVSVILVDERWNTQDRDSNEWLVKNCLLKNKAAAATFINLYTQNSTIEEAVGEAEAKLARIPLFDAVILGMGEDGHTASLFPGSRELEYGLSNCAKDVIALTPMHAPFQRITLTKPRLLRTRKLFLQLVGENKMRVFQEALADNDVLTMPIRAFLNQPATRLQVMFAPS
ncbi:6-phosphogluconolactonase [Legionella quinlivanii]|uniref:6-phosphogluconolactonase n=1 Tax=Legionella quinlivanii TaxID=45073 RepID=A0A0W0XZX5_9GAMM|nr:6-phosphogluconolactonase [Legionella quinlivanii]KTD49954.1 6-phosphogluconolactonase [Legionella quinlivanii]MCW8450549.1 6-phosphogluconolactonase [Legionella quinlivanii]SEF96725.1 6-phosphogluconolactonase [Legionella quinlivanii DSM 21216]STY11270.1 6-phosphogluconolactonase [Legionella quinlivanii]